MTKPNVLTPDTKSCITTLIGVPESMAVLGGILGITQHKNVVKKLEGAKVSTWIDSMRAASPTRVKSNNLPSSENQEKCSWILYHPSALSKFDEIKYNSKGKKIVVFLDYDGTLSPIVADPDKAFMTRQMRATLKNIAKHFPTAIVTGRCRDKSRQIPKIKKIILLYGDLGDIDFSTLPLNTLLEVFNFVKLGELYYAASHGMDIMGPTKSRNLEKGNDKVVLFQPASQFLPLIDEVYKILLEKTKSVPGAKVENNKFCLSVHFRCVDEKSWAVLAEKVRLVLNEYPQLRLTQGRKVLEIRPTIKWDKGKALEFLLESLGYENSDDVFPIYIGDDRTDEDAFKVLRRRDQGVGILVSRVPKETEASYSLQDPSEVEQFLRCLVEWERSTIS